MTIKNLTEDNISILISLCLGYAKIALSTAKEESKRELWYNHMLMVSDILDRKNLQQKSEDPKDERPRIRLLVLTEA